MPELAVRWPMARGRARARGLAWPVYATRFPPSLPDLLAERALPSPADASLPLRPAGLRRVPECSRHLELFASPGDGVRQVAGHEVVAAQGAGGEVGGQPVHEDAGHRGVLAVQALRHSTSPLPAVPSAGLAVGFTKAVPSGVAMMVRAPLSTTTAWAAAASRRAVPSRSFWISGMVAPAIRAISPG
jgi:hypothetical protein